VEWRTKLSDFFIVGNYVFNKLSFLSSTIYMFNDQPSISHWKNIHFAV
jgi:hypothetical protein